MGNCFNSKESTERPSNNKSAEQQPEKKKETSEGLVVDDIEVKVNDEQQQNVNQNVKQEQDGGLEVQNKEKDKQNDAELQSMDNHKDVKREKKKMKKVVAGVLDEDETTIYEKINKINRQLTKADIEFNKRALGQHFIFVQLKDSEKDQIIQKMFYCENSEQYVFQKGDQASSYFIIEKGECEVIINNKIVRTLGQGNGFGELALLYGSARTASIRCKGSCAFWGIDRKTFRNTVEEIVRREFDENRKFIEQTKFFKIMTDPQKDSITHVTITQVFKKGDWVVSEGDEATSYYIIKKGSVMAVKGGENVRKMEAGEEFGEQALINDSKRGATVRVEEDDTQLLAIGRDQIQRVLGDKVQVIMWNNLQKWAFERNSLLCKLSKIQIERIVNNTKHVQYQEQNIIYVKGKTPNKLVFVLEGSLKKQKSNKEVATKGQVYGEEWLMEKMQNSKLDEDIIVGDRAALLAEIDFEIFFRIIGDKLEAVLKKLENNHEVKYMKKYDDKDKGKYDYMKLPDFVNIKKLGFGQFGSVFLTKNKSDSKYYALKVIQKSQVIEQSLEKHLQQEKKVLESVDFPFIMKFCRSFKDQNNIYFLVEYVKGMELFDVIREIGLLNSYDSKFYIGSLLLCIEYLHTNSIIYRDIKPENIMVDNKGYMKLIDMGTAKYLKGKGGRTFTIIGTPHYMAPEIITGKGYTYSVDLWSIGICLYEFMCGGVPFAEDAEDPYEIYESIIKTNLQFPTWLKDSHAKKIMHQLLNKQPELRLGGGYPSLKANPWFDNFDWDKLMDRELKAPYVPPKDKMISDNDVRKQENLNKLVLDEIKKDQKDVKKSKASSKLQDWDKEF